MVLMMMVMVMMVMVMLVMVMVILGMMMKLYSVVVGDDFFDFDFDFDFDYDFVEKVDHRKQNLCAYDDYRPLQYRSFSAIDRSSRVVRE